MRVPGAFTHPLDGAVGSVCADADQRRRVAIPRADGKTLEWIRAGPAISPKISLARRISGCSLAAR